jgi:hypothetical protein
VAGALLRAEWKIMADDEESGTIGSKYLTVIEEDWSRRFGLNPDIYTLRKRHHEWLGQGMPKPAPLDANQIISLYED